MSRCAIGVLVCVLAASSAARGATVEPITFEELVQRAERIFVGEVVAVEPVTDRNSIRTRVTFRVADTVKGHASTLVQLTFLGGQVGDVALEVSGMPKFNVGDEN